MTHRTRSALSIVALAALAGCGGNGNAAAPASLTPVSVAAGSVPANSTLTYAMPESAPNGVRTFVHLPLRSSDQLDALIEQQSTKGAPLYQHWLTPAQFRDAYGPAATDLQAAAAALRASGFTTTITSQTIVADAPQATVERTFGIHLQLRTESVDNHARSLLVGDRAPTVSAALNKFNPQVVAFSNHVLRPQHMLASTNPNNRYGPTGGDVGYWFDDLKQAYRYPSHELARGTGKTIAIVGAGDFLDSDITKYFNHEHLPAPAVVRRPVSGGPAPFDSNLNGPLVSEFLEANLDVQQAGGSAPGAKLIFYGGGGPEGDASDSTFIALYLAIAEDNLADVVSASYGQCELDYTAAYENGIDQTYVLQLYHDLFRQMNAQGITIVNSSGDFGAYECTDPSGATAKLGVSSWADDPDVTGVGGTNLVTTFVQGSLESKYVSENAYDDKFAADSGEPAGAIFGSGGGKSAIFSRPTFQRLVSTRTVARAVPDVAMHIGGCPVGAVTPCGPGDRSADVSYFGGQLIGLIGTSASAPEFAGLQAIQDGILGNRQGNVNYLLYSLAAARSFGNGPIFNDDIPGNNGYRSMPGYNYVLGNGTVNGAQYALEPFGPFAGNPQTPTNP